MRPGFSLDYISDGSPGYAEAPRDVANGDRNRIKPPDFFDVRRFEFGSTDALSPGDSAPINSPSSAHRHLAHIFRMVASGEVLRVYARRIIARVEHKKTFFNWTYKLLMGDTVYIDRDYTVALPNFRALPFPAAAALFYGSFFNALPKGAYK